MKKINNICLLFLTITLLNNCKKSDGEKIYYCNSQIYFLNEEKGDSIFKIINSDNLSYMIGQIKSCNRIGKWEEYSMKDNYLMYKWTYKDDLRNGIYFDYTKYGKIQTVGFYKNDVLDGALIYFDYKNKIKKIEYWKGIGGASELIYSKIINETK